MMTSSTSSWFLCLLLCSCASLSSPILVKSIRFLADLIAALYFRAIINILNDWNTLHAISSSSSLTSSATVAFLMIESKNIRLHATTIKKSNLFHVPLFRYFLKPCILILRAKSTVTVVHIMNSNVIKNGDRATRNPSTIVIRTNIKQTTMRAT